MEAVRFSGVGYSFGSWKALNDLEFTASTGEYIALIGRNGSGKSTLARHINALLRPDEGSVHTFAMDTKDDALTIAIRSAAGMVFQNPDNQIVASVVEEDVAFGPENLGVPTEEIEKRVDLSLLAVDMQSYRLRAPYQLSGGQKQRIAIAGVLAMQPKLIIFDESTSMLDPVGREAVLSTMEALHKAGITILHITHSMDEALRADRLIVLHDGRIELDGTPQDIFSRHADRLIELGMELPPLMSLAHELKLMGIDAGPGLSMEETVDRLCQLP